MLCKLNHQESPVLSLLHPYLQRLLQMITEGEIMDAINRPLGARTMDGVKRRTRAGMGRCQAGFCTPRTMEILSRELGIPMTEITKKGEGSNLLVGKIKED